MVIGASVGGVRALQRIAAGLPGGFSAPVLVVLHVGARESILPELLDARGPLDARHARHGDALEAGTILVAPPDRHMRVQDGHVRLDRGPREHHARPAVDPLFLSAALARGAAVVGVVLTGDMDDGTVGLQAIKECGGVAIVQDPRDAEAPGMPESALRYVEVDYCLPLEAIVERLVQLAGEPSAEGEPAPRRLALEQEVSLAKGDTMEKLDEIGSQVPLTCPDCQGPLWEVDDGRQPLRYRCHTGHAFTLRSLQSAQVGQAEEALWSAVRALKEKRLLFERLARLARREGREEDAVRREDEAWRTAQHVLQLRRLLEGEPAAAGGDPR